MLIFKTIDDFSAFNKKLQEIIDEEIINWEIKQKAIKEDKLNHHQEKRENTLHKKGFLPLDSISS